MSKHTPGPWTVRPFDTADKWIEIPEPSVEVDFDDVDHEEQAANARLIAAAPELLETLKETRREVEVLLMVANDIGPNTADLLNRVALLIAKAEGE